jgi:hypothetical protein
LTFPKGVEEVVMLAVDGIGLSLTACWVEGLEVLEGLEGISGLSRGEAISESESGEASGLLVSESSSMAGYGGGGGSREEGGSDGEDVVSCGREERVVQEVFVRQTDRAAWWRPVRLSLAGRWQ